MDHPNLYKKHWKTPFRDSPYNVQPQERTITDEENCEVYTPTKPQFDPNNKFDRLVSREQFPDMTIQKEMFDQANMTTD